MKFINYIRGFFGRSRMAIPLAWSFLRVTMDCANPYTPTRSMAASVWKDVDGGFHSSSTKSSVPRMIHTSEESYNRFMNERKARENGR